MNRDFVGALQGQLDQFKKDRVYKRLNYLSSPQDAWVEMEGRGKVLAFVEVKARATDEAAALSLDAWRLRRVVTAAERLAPRYMKPGDDLRIDAVFIVPGRLPRHVSNIWQG